MARDKGDRLRKKPVKRIGLVLDPDTDTGWPLAWLLVQFKRDEAGWKPYRADSHSCATNFYRCLCFFSYLAHQACRGESVLEPRARTEPLVLLGRTHER